MCPLQYHVRQLNLSARSLKPATLSDYLREICFRFPLPPERHDGTDSPKTHHGGIVFYKP